MWFSIVYRRWRLFGTVTFVAAQVAVVTPLLIGAHYYWRGVSYYLPAAGLTSLLAALAALLFVGGYATIRRVTV
jgi:hypothetical protein